MLKKNRLYKNIMPVLLSLVINTFITAGLIFIGENYILAKIKYFTSTQRGYAINPFDADIGVAFFFIVSCYVLYYSVILFFIHYPLMAIYRVIVGMLSGIIPLILLGMGTFGFNLSYPGTLMETIILLLSGSLIPYLEQKIKKNIIKQ